MILILCSARDAACVCAEVYTLEYRLNFYYKSNAQSLRPISPWHDIPLNRLGTGEQGQLFNFVCEIPKWTRAKVCEI